MDADNTKKSAKKTPDKYNLIYIFADQLRYASLGYNGDAYAYTPNIDRLSENFSVLDNAVSGHPVCAPYRASLLTGKYTTSTGMVINEIRINPNHRTIAGILTENGYETCYIGKWHLYADKLGDHFNVENSYIPRGKDRLGFDDYFAGYNFHHSYYAPQAYYHEDSPEKIFVDGYEPDAQTDMAIGHLKRLTAGEKPFAFFLSLGTPHDPWVKGNVPDEYYKRFEKTEFPVPPNYKKFNDRHADIWARFFPWDRPKLNEWKRVYYAMVSNLDYNIGRLFAAIDEMGLRENTILVFTSDHGEMFGAQGRRAKNIFYDEAVRVPFLLRAPKLKTGKIDTAFNTVDIMPTLLSFMGMPIPREVEGKDRSKQISGEEPQEEFDGCLMQGTGPTAVYGNGFEWRAYRTRRYTYAVYLRGGKEMLFDNVSDPYQTRNMVKDTVYSGILAELKKRMYAEMESIGDDFEKNSFYKEHWVKDRRILPALARRKDL